MCLSNRKKSKFLPKTVKTAYKVVTLRDNAGVAKGSVVYSPCRGFPIETGKWVKAQRPKTRGFCVYQRKVDAVTDATYYNDVVFTVYVRKIVATGTFGGEPCWAAAEIFIPKQPCQTPKT